MISSKIFINMSDDKPIKFSDKAIMGSDTDYSNYFSMMYHLRNQAKTNGVHSYLMGDVILDTMQSLIDSKPKERDFLKHAHVTQSDEDEKHYRKELNAKCIQDPLYPNQLLICADPKNPFSKRPRPCRRSNIQCVPSCTHIGSIFDAFESAVGTSNKAADSRTVITAIEESVISAIAPSSISKNIPSLQPLSDPSMQPSCWPISRPSRNPSVLSLICLQRSR
jgi:hypothetical protein